MQVVLGPMVVTNYQSSSSLEAGLADEYSYVLCIKRFCVKLYGQYKKFSGLCVAAEVKLLKKYCANYLKVLKVIKRLASWIPIAIYITFIL